MALTYGFYNSVEGDRKYDAIQMGQIFDGIITDGVYATFLKAMVVKASENASEVIVQPGRCWFNHTWTYIDADYPVEAPAPEVILDRVDALVIDINTENAFRANSLVWVQGTPSSLNPERPSLIKSVTHNQYPLCYVYRKAGTTMIYAADITNAVGTSETPFVTGVLTGINIDDLLAQWDDEFHTWEAATKTSFEAWMVNQQSVYVTWFDSIKDQMEGDLTDFEAWFETIRGIIDEEAATHLQAEIDALSEMLPAGSHIDVSTSEPTLFNRNVTVSDGVHSKTVQFDASGAATVESFPYIGIISVTSTDGTRTAEESINIPYFGRYSTVLAFWSATVNLVGDESLAALPVTVRDGNGDVVAIVTLNASGMGVFTATKPDTYKFIYTYGGQTMEVSLAVTQETTYEVEIHGGFNYQAWLTAGRVSKTFSSLDDILADEETLRQLFLVHDSVDYICDTFSTGSATDVTKIFNTDLAAKWINLSDYALDHFYAVAGIKSIMDTVDKYGYGEWTLMPQVPTMTSNTAPYGEAGATTDSSSAYLAFNGTNASGTSDCWNGTKNNRLYYKFTDPVCIKKVLVANRNNSTVYAVKTLIVQASNDNITWVDLGTFTKSDGQSVEDTFEITNSDSYLYYGIYVSDVYDTSATTMYCRVGKLQFYAWAPKGNVPVMTSNTAPYGEVIASSYISGNENYKAFDRYADTYWRPNTTVPAYCGYKFTLPLCVKRVSITHHNASAVAREITHGKIQASNDNNTWVDIVDDFAAPSATRGLTYYVDCSENSESYLYYRVYVTAVGSGNDNRPYIGEIQFYGRELKVSVPKMTSNTAPYGEVITNTTYEANSVYRAFDNDLTTNVIMNGVGSRYAEYVFASKVNIKKIEIVCKTGDYEILTYRLQGSDDGTNYEDIIVSESRTRTNNFTWVFGDVNANYKRFRLTPLTSTKNSAGTIEPNTYAQPYIINFYGVDYSEKEFEVGTTKKWLYDHGVMLESISNAVTSGGVITYGNDFITFDRTNSSANLSIATDNTIDISSYSKFFSIVDTIKNSSIELIAVGSSRTSGTSGTTANKVVSMVGGNVKDCLDVSSINQSLYPVIFANNVGAFNIKELWLE